jgi:DNA-binding NtrC family response regulator
MTQILLVGSDGPLLEGLAQSLAAMGHTPRVTTSIAEAQETASHAPPLVLLASRLLLAEGGAGALLGVRLAPGGAVLLYHEVGGAYLTLPPAVQRSVLADLSLPLERNRFLTLVQHVEDRAQAAGRGLAPGGPGSEAPLPPA